MEPISLLEPTWNTTTNVLLRQLTEQTGYGDYAVLFLSLIGLTGYATNGKLWNKPDPYHYKWFERPQEATSQNSQVKETRNIAQKLDESTKDLVIFWGSQSGTAEAFAHRLARECHRRFKLDAIVADLSDYDSDTIALIPRTKFAVFVMSTYGEGDPSDNASDFWEWMKTSSMSLSNLRYAAFGLGNSNYKYYNKVIDVLVQKLDACHATSLLPVGKADDASNGTEEDFLAWKELLFQMFQTKLGYLEHDQVYQPTMKVVEDTSLDIIDLHVGEPIAQSTNRKAANQTSAVGALSVKHVKQLTSGSSTDRSCLHLELDLSDHLQLKYKTGDHLSVYPVNSTDEVERLLRVLCLEERRDIPLLISSLDPSTTKLKIPSPTNLPALFTSYLEISAPVSREVVQALTFFAPSETIKSMLKSIATDKKTYATFLSRNHITLARLLEYTLLQDPSSSWAHLPLSFVLETLQPMTPRHYSISSSSVTSPKQLSITVANTPTPLISNPTITIPGLTTSYLSTLQGSSSSSSPIDRNNNNKTTKVYASIRRSTFKLPASPKAPLVLIGAGTGIAPLRAFIHERAALADMGRETGDILFFYGCRNADEDYLYREEIENFSRTSLKNSLNVVTAFSRPIDDGRKKMYVQHCIAQPALARQVARMMVDDDAALFICGSTVMAKDAGDAVMVAVADKVGWTVDEALSWRDERRRVGRWKEDVWG